MIFLWKMYVYRISYIYFLHICLSSVSDATYNAKKAIIKCIFLDHVPCIAPKPEGKKKKVDHNNTCQIPRDQLYKAFPH